MEKGTERALSTAEIELALSKLEVEIKYRPSIPRSTLTILVGMLPFLGGGALILSFAFFRIDQRYCLASFLLSGILYLAYFIGKKFIPESGFFYSSNIQSKITRLFNKDQLVKDYTEQRGMSRSCLLSVIFLSSMAVCITSWAVIPVLGFIFTRMPNMLIIVGLISLLVFSLTWMLNELKRIIYYTDVHNLEQKFRSYLIQAETTKEVNVGSDVLSGIEKVETNQSLRKASKAFRQSEWEPIGDEEKNIIQSLREKKTSSSDTEGKE